MLADGIGLVNYYNSIIEYIVLFTSLGIPVYAVREIAKVRNDPKKLSITGIEILLLNVFFSLLGYIVVGVLSTFSGLQMNLPLFWLLSLSIFMTAIGGNWFYQGIEDFQYITIRGLIVKTIGILLLFLLVKDKSDIMWYGAYVVFGVLGGNFFNLLRFNKYIKKEYLIWKELHPLNHMKPCLHIYALSLITSIYVNLASVMLGAFSTVEAVGYYTGATRLTKMTLGVVTSLGIVMLPRLSNIIVNNDYDSFTRLSNKACRFICAISIPLTVGLFFMSKSLIRLFCGPSYEPSILTLQIISPILLMIALSNLLGIQILYPQGKENIVILCCGLGAMINFALNWLFIPDHAQYGAALANVIAESIVTVSMYIIGKKYIPIRLFTKFTFHYFIAATGMGVFIYCLLQLKFSDAVNVLTIPLAGAFFYLIFLVLIKDELLLDIIDYAKNYITKR
jgi:O-antigen/teichoic acid export membrane protein